MPEAHEEAIAFIKKVKQFGETELGIDFHGSFEGIEEKTTHRYWLYVSHPYAVKNALRNATHVSSMSESAIIQLADEYKSEGFDTDVFQGEAFYNPRGPCPILPSLLSASRARQANVVLHEGMHSALKIPLFRRNYDLDESSVTVTGNFGAISFAEYVGDAVLRQELIDQNDEWVRYCNFINWGLDELSAAYRACSSARLPEIRNLTLTHVIEVCVASQVLWGDAEELRSKINNAYFLHNRLYTTFYPLMLKVHQALGSDIKKTTLLIRSLPPKRKDALAALNAVAVSLSNLL